MWEGQGIKLQGTYAEIRSNTAFFRQTDNMFVLCEVNFLIGLSRN